MSAARDAGLLAARFIPADPQTFLDACLHHSFHVGYHNHRLHLDMMPDNTEAGEFLRGWLAGTPGGELTLARFLAARNIQRTT